MRFRFDSSFDQVAPDTSSLARRELPAQAAGEELRRYMARAMRGDGAAGAAFCGSFEPQVRRAVRRVLARGTPDQSRLGRRVREELKRVLQSHPNARLDPSRVEQLVTLRICRSMVSRPSPARIDEQAIKDTVRN